MTTNVFFEKLNVILSAIKDREDIAKANDQLKELCEPLGLNATIRATLVHQISEHVRLGKISVIPFRFDRNKNVIINNGVLLTIAAGISDVRQYANAKIRKSITEDIEEKHEEISSLKSDIERLEKELELYPVKPSINSLH